MRVICKNQCTETAPQRETQEEAGRGTVTIESAFVTLVGLHGDALVVGPDPFLGNQRLQLVARAADHKLPAIYFSNGFTSAGGLIS
jgi:putative tryptophan/tyrosine transport system substrate-binding protein